MENLKENSVFDTFENSLRVHQPYLSEDELLFYSIEINYSDKNNHKKKIIKSYRNIFDRRMIAE